LKEKESPTNSKILGALIIVIIVAMFPLLTTTVTTNQRQQTNNFNNTTRKGAPPTGAYWAKSYGGSGDDIAWSTQQTKDGGYIVAGTTNSFGAAGTWVLKLNSTGGVTWQKIYAGSGAYYVQLTSDGGYIVAGTAGSNASVLKLDSGGGVTWAKTYGDTKNIYNPYYVQQTTDGGYVVAGYTTPNAATNASYWVLKLFRNGSIEWQKTYGAPNNFNIALSAQQTTDGGYIVAGINTTTYSVWVIKLDPTGAVTWQKTYGGDNQDETISVRQTADGGYIVAGGTYRYGTEDHGNFWILKLDSTGGITWQTTYGGIYDDGATSVEPTSDGGYIVSGYTDSFGAGLMDVWVFKLRYDGEPVWQKAYGGSGNDESVYMQQTADGGYIMAGWTSSFGAGGPTYGSDFWIVKLGSGGEITWNPGSGASTLVTLMGPAASYAKANSTFATPAGGTATATNVSITPTDTNAVVKTQASPDTTPPVTITNLAASSPTTASLLLTWTAPGDNGMSGTATGYVVKYSTTGSITPSNWASATIYPQSWTPLVAGNSESHVVSGLSVATKYWFAVEAYDEVPNYGGLSNSPSASTLAPAPTIDHPSSVMYTVGQTGNSITWHPQSQIPDNYTISVNGGSPTSQTWNGSSINVSVDGLAAGTYKYNCTVYDTQGGSASSTITVTVQPPPANGIPAADIVVVVAVGVVAVASIAAFLKIKTSKKQS
jgi:hypothetical protein